MGLERYSNDPVLQFFKAYGVLGEDHIHDAISELESLQSHPHMSLCSVMALLYAHKCCDTIGLREDLKAGTSRKGEAGSMAAGLIPPDQACVKACLIPHQDTINK
ncbi:Tetratricopeptide repeat protein 21A [Cricetulus griseus]|uniref:Tetratricopeptide repeat domain 21A n=1 Tax=Cricetulus griseus TaxID=10029 RepID=G3HQW3_CRIGR|nr:Tetratricopeptide repeat protein 21A [Cricetulus griseus]